MNKEQLELLDVVYKDYVESYNKGNAAGIRLDDGSERVANIDEFIRRIRQDIPFTEKFGLKFEKRDLTWEEKSKFLDTTDGPWDSIARISTEMDIQKIPTKLIKITYNDKAIESYE